MAATATAIATAETALAQLAADDSCRRAQRVRLACRPHAHNLRQLAFVSPCEAIVLVCVVIECGREDLFAYFAETVEIQLSDETGEFVGLDWFLLDLVQSQEFILKRILINDKTIPLWRPINRRVSRVIRNLKNLLDKR